MLSSTLYPAVLSLSAIITLTNGQVFPQCIRTCIDNSQYSNCQVTDLACLCRAGRTSGSFLPSLVTCMHNSCIDIGVDILLSPLQITCVLAGAPLPDSAVNAAKSQASNLATQTTTATETETATTEFTSVGQTTITKTEQGSTHIIVFPITIDRTTTISGEPSTVTKDASSTPTPSGNSAALSSVLSSLVSSARSSSSLASSTSQESTSTSSTSTTVLGEAVTSSMSSSTSTQSAGATSTSAPGAQDSAPFTNTNTAGRVMGSSWFGMGILVVMGVVFF